MHSKTKQIVAMQVGPRDKQTAEELFLQTSRTFKKTLYYTGDFSVYYETIPFLQHLPVGKESGKTCYVERLNCTLRQRCSRLVRKALSFSQLHRNDYVLHMRL
jgi:IS1 family transposase